MSTLGLTFTRQVAKFEANTLTEFKISEMLASQNDISFLLPHVNELRLVLTTDHCQLLPGEEVRQQLEAELDVAELLLKAGQALLDHVLPTVHIRDDLVHRVLSLKCGNIEERICLNYQKMGPRDLNFDSNKCQDHN